MFKNNFYSYVGGTRQDISISLESYFEIVEVLLDQYLSREVRFALILDVVQFQKLQSSA